MDYENTTKFEKYYFRKIGSAEFIKQDISEKSEFYLLKTSPKSSYIENMGKTVESEFQLEYAELITEINSQVNKFSDRTKKVIDWRSGKFRLNRKPGDQYRKINEYFKNQEKLKSVHQFLQDEKGFPKDIYLVKEEIDGNKFAVTLFCIDRSKLNYAKIQNGSQMIPYLSNKFVFDFDTGDMDMNMEFDAQMQVDFPEELMKDFLALRNRWAGMELTTVCSVSGLSFFQSLCEFPYEPNFSVIHNMCLGSGLTLADRCNPAGFNEFCEKNNIHNCKRLRKIFAETPEKILFVYELQNCGFTDVNIIYDIVNTKRFRFLRNCMDSNMFFFMKYALKFRSEKAVWNLFQSDSGFYEMRDILSMFTEYSDRISDEIKEKLIYDGFTKYNHDVLAKAITSIKEKNIDFSYDKNQLALEDNIMGYEFKLPKDSDSLRDIGNKMENCVQTYKGKILSKSSTIVYAEKESEKKICIEIKNGCVVQCYAQKNQKLKKGELIVVKRWMQKKQLN